MCVIIDTNMFGSFLDPENIHMRHLKEWIERKGGKIAYSPTRSLENELNRSTNMRNLMASYNRAGKLKLKDKKKVEIKQKEISKNRNLKSNDPHIIALAMISNAKVLVSQDQNLIYDFKEIIGAGVYKKIEHKHLLTNDPCP